MSVHEQLPIGEPARGCELGAHLPPVAQDLALMLGSDACFIKGRNEIALEVGLAQIPRSCRGCVQPELVLRVPGHGEEIGNRGDRHRNLCLSWRRGRRFAVLCRRLLGCRCQPSPVDDHRQGIDHARRKISAMLNQSVLSGSLKYSAKMRNDAIGHQEDAGGQPRRHERSAGCA